MSLALDALQAKLSAKQIRAIASVGQQKVSIWHGAVSAGKTFASLIALLVAVSRAPLSGLLVVTGRSLQTIERNVLYPLMDAAVFGVFASAVKHTTGSTQAVILGRVVHLIGANDVRAEGKIRGATICLAYCDEASLLPQPFWMMLLSRLRVPNARNILIATTNPDSPLHWLRKDFILRGAAAGVTDWHFVLNDNPALDEDYKRTLIAQYTGLWYRRFILGEWCAAEGMIWDMFDPSRHVVPATPLVTRWPAVGIDYGTVNPFVALLAGVGVDEGGAHRLHIASEWRWDSTTKMRQKTDSEYSRDVQEWLATYTPPGTEHKGVHPERIVVDPSAASFITQLWQDRLSPVGGDNAVLDGIRMVSNLLAKDLLRIHASCTGLIEEIGSYAWDPKATAKGEDKPLKMADHGPDALRYLVATTEWDWRHELREPEMEA